MNRQHRSGPGPGPGHGPRRRRTARGARTAAQLCLATLALAGFLGGCGSAARVPDVAQQPPVASAALSQTLLNVRAQVMGALSAAGLQAADARTPYRSAESPALASAPRAVLQVVLPAAPDAGHVVLYEFADPGTATAAAEEFVQYLASGPGRIQFPNDAHFTLRQLGAALAFNVWSPSASSDPDGEEAIETTLASVGQGYVVLR